MSYEESDLTLRCIQKTKPLYLCDSLTLPQKGSLCLLPRPIERVKGRLRQVLGLRDYPVSGIFIPGSTTTTQTRPSKVWDSRPSRPESLDRHEADGTTPSDVGPPPTHFGRDPGVSPFSPQGGSSRQNGVVGSLSPCGSSFSSVPVSVTVLLTQCSGPSQCVGAS